MTATPELSAPVRALEQQIHDAFKAATPMVVKLGSQLPPEAYETTPSALLRQAPDAPIGVFGWPETGTIRDVCGQIVGAPRQGSSRTPVVCGHTRLFDVSRSLGAKLFDMPVVRAWSKKVSLMWVGGTEYPALHFDPWDNVLIQLCGRKRYIVYYPSVSYDVQGWNQGVAPAEQELGRLPGVTTHVIEGVLEPGDGLVIPCGALHALWGERNSISINMFLSGGPTPSNLRLRYRYLVGHWFWSYLSSILSPKFDALFERVGVNMPMWREESRIFLFLSKAWPTRAAYREGL